MKRDLLAQRITEVLTELLETGWKCPICAVSVGANGSMVGCRYDEDTEKDSLSCKLLAEWYDPAGILLPINVMFCNGKGEAILILIEQSDEKPKILN